VTVDRRDVLMELYRAFNDRDIDAALEHLAPEVDWPNGMTGGRVHGRDAVRRYWQKQWSEIDPRVEPLEITEDEAGRAHVRVDQLVRSLDGKILQNRQIEHVYEFAGPFISRMTIVEPEEIEDDTDE
jgi:ketosteroid isomerase-like protein